MSEKLNELLELISGDDCSDDYEPECAVCRVREMFARLEAELADERTKREVWERIARDADKIKMAAVRELDAEMDAQNVRLAEQAHVLGGLRDELIAKERELAAAKDKARLMEQLYLDAYEALAIRTSPPAWIPVSERLPEINQQVLIIGNYWDRTSIGARTLYPKNKMRDPKQWYWEMSLDGHLLRCDGCVDPMEYQPDEVTHWMPLPAPPSDGGSAAGEGGV